MIFLNTKKLFWKIVSGIVEQPTLESICFWAFSINYPDASQFSFRFPFFLAVDRIFVAVSEFCLKKKDQIFIEKKNFFLKLTAVLQKF